MWPEPPTGRALTRTRFPPAVGRQPRSVSVAPASALRERPTIQTARRAGPGGAPRGARGRLLGAAPQCAPRSLATSCSRRSRAEWLSGQILLAGDSLPSSSRIPRFLVGVSPVRIMLLISLSRFAGLLLK